MSFNPNIPLGTDKILQSALQLRANFQAIDASFADNHVGMTRDPEFSGMHQVLTLRPQALDPITGATDTALYNKAVAGVPELFYAPSNAQTPIQLTYPSIKTDLSNTQYSFIAGPFIVYGGFIAAPVQNQVVTLTPGTTLLYVDLTVANSSLGIAIINMAVPTLINTPANSFTIRFQTSAVGTFDLYYLAIGI